MRDRIKLMCWLTVLYAVIVALVLAELAMLPAEITHGRAVNSFEEGTVRTAPEQTFAKLGGQELQNSFVCERLSA